MFCSVVFTFNPFEPKAKLIPHLFEVFVPTLPSKKKRSRGYQGVDPFTTGNPFLGTKFTWV